ncbi:MAG TPA: glycosyl hydrolase family 32, partial [Cytophagales bacterium]|nr:glycosyl hydrolase family 32 [Cytophagales bacterium]
LFTYHDEAAKLAGATDYQSQGLAYSLDKGRTWTKYAENPVLPNSGIEDFRDPKVFWHQDTGRWIMSLAVANHIWFYSSTNLLDWTYESAFGHDQGAHGGVWECPDLFPLPIEGTEEEAWVLLVSVTEGGPNGGSATQYFVGHFDGCTFSVHPDAPDPELPTSPAKGAEPALWLDWGTDNYAGVTWSDIPSEDGRRIFLGWMSNWQYAQVVPTMTWRSAMTLPRVLSLAPDLRLRQAPIHPFDDYGKALETKDMYTTEAAQQTQLPLGQYLAFEADLSDAESFSLVLGDQEEYVSFTLTPKQGLMDLSREHSGETTFHQAFANPILGNWKGASPTVRYEVFVDESSVEIFLNGGEQVFSVLVFPSERYNQATFTANGKAVILKVVSKELSLQS